jgi:membrane-associated phospholipid phosphatase
MGSRRSPAARYAGKGALRILAGFLLICLIGVASSYVTPDALDRRWLLAINPDAPRPLLDGLMVAVTDYSIPYVAILLACCGIGAEARLRGRIAAPRLLPVFAVLGVALAAFAFLAFGAKYAEQRVPIAMTPLIAGGFLFAGASLARFDAAALARVRRCFWLALIAVLLAELAIKLVVDLGPGRARPISHANAGWNAALRLIPDEHVRGHTSYPSGHAGAISALLAPIVWIARSRALRFGAIALAAACVYSRVYLAAHFPSDAFAGAAIGASLGTLVTLTLGNAWHSGVRDPARRPPAAP